MDSSQPNHPSGGHDGRRKGKGRQRIAIEKITNETNRQVTFSKRRAGLFKKASELGTLCGAESAIIVFSPSNKAHSFGSPSVDAITDRFLGQVALGRSDGDRTYLGPPNPIMRHRNQELSELEARLEKEKKHKKEEKASRQAGRTQLGSPPDLDTLNYKQLKQLKKSVASLKRSFEAKIKNAEGVSQGGPSFGPPVIPGGPGHDPMFDIGPSGNPNVVFSNNVPVARNASSGFLPDMMGSNNPGFFEPFDPTVGNYGFAFSGPNEAGGPGFMVPSYNSGFAGDGVSHGGVASGAAGQEGVVQRGTQGYGEDQPQGFNNYYGSGN